MRRILFILLEMTYIVMMAGSPWAADAPLSVATQECLDCHDSLHPGIVKDWRRSRHAAVTPGTSLTQKGPARRVSSTDIPDTLHGTAVGCAECHTLRGENHSDTFEHNGYRIHLVPSPDDCAVCHGEERGQYAENIMSMAEKNLSENVLYQDIQHRILGAPRLEKGRVSFDAPDDAIRADACYYCHGTRLKVTGTLTRDTDAGKLVFPIISGWPNQGVGRVNLDGSRGSCSACHTRHQFSIEMARKPHTCKECHGGPDVPAYKVYDTSKHGNIYSAKEKQWNFSNVPWRLGQDFTAPTCAVCHISQSVDANGDVISPRTHRMTDRLGWRIFGLIYAHPQPKSPDTTMIRNRSGLPLPTDLDGTPALSFLISTEQMQGRRDNMRKICLNCHTTSWVGGHFQRLDHVIASTNASVRTAAQLMQQGWQKGIAQGLDRGGSIFDEPLERRFSDIWLIYANNIRFSAAMAGGGDFGVFDDGRYPLTGALLDMHARIGTEPAKAPVGPTRPTRKKP